MVKRLPILAAIAACLLVPLQIMAQPMADRVPADALFYGSWRGMDAIKAQYEASNLKAVIDASSLPAFLRTQLPELIKKVDPAKGAVAQASVEALMMGAKYPAAIYIGPVDFSVPGEARPRVAIFIDSGAQTAALEERLKVVVNNENAADPNLNAALQRTGNGLVLTIGKVNLNQPKLNTKPEFAATFAKLKADAAVFAYADMQAVIKELNNAAAKGIEQNNAWQSLRDTFGLQNLKRVGAAAGFEGADWQSDAVIDMSDPEVGPLGRAFFGRPLAPGALKNVPEAATWVTAMRFDPSVFTRQVEVAVIKGNPQNGQAEIDQFWKEFTDKTGVKAREEIIDTLGDSWVAYTSPNVGGTSWSGLTMVNELKDATKLAASFAKLEQMAMDVQSSASAPARPGQPDLRIQSTKFRDLEVHYVNMFMFNPSWAIQNKRLFMGMTPQSVASAANQATQARSILDNENFKAVQKKLGVSTYTSMSYVDAPKLAPEGMMILNQAITMANSMANANIPPTVLPPIYEVLPHLQPSGSATWLEKDGLHCRSYSSFPGSSLLASQQSGLSFGGPMALAILLPSLSRAREQARITADVSNLSEIGACCYMWSQEHDERFPDHMAQIVEEGYLGVGARRMFSSPFSQHKPFIIPNEIAKKAKESGDMRPLAKLIDENSDYLYFGKGIDKKSQEIHPSTTILAMSKPGLDGKFVNVLFVDGHVEKFMTDSKTLPEIFEQTNAFRKKSGLEPLDMEKLFKNAAGKK